MRWSWKPLNWLLVVSATDPVVDFLVPLDQVLAVMLTGVEAMDVVVSQLAVRVSGWF